MGFVHAKIDYEVALARIIAESSRSRDVLRGQVGVCDVSGIDGWRSRLQMEVILGSIHKQRIDGDVSIRASRIRATTCKTCCARTECIIGVKNRGSLRSAIAIKSVSRSNHQVINELSFLKEIGYVNA